MRLKTAMLKTEIKTIEMSFDYIVEVLIVTVFNIEIFNVV